jgi:hypothetical protein
MLNDMMQRADNAHKDLIEVLAEHGAGYYAPDVAELYIKEKLVKLDANIGRYIFKHGAFLDSEVINNAIKAVKK